MHENSMIKININVLPSSGREDIRCDLSIKMDSVVASMKLHLDLKKYMQASVFDFAMKGACYEPDYTSIMLKVLKPGDTVIDIGANFGYFSLLASSLVTNSGRVISLEPEKENFKFFVRNIKLNQAFNILPLQVAAGKYKQEVELFIDPLNDGGHSLGGISPETSDQIGSTETLKSKVQMDTLDSLLNTEKVTNIKIIKIDTEGWEFDVIEGTISAIKKFSPLIILAEVNRLGLRRAGASERYLRLLMAELGYSTYVGTCLQNSKLVLELFPEHYYAEPELEHYNYNAVFARPESLNDFSACYHIFN